MKGKKKEVIGRNKSKFSSPHDDFRLENGGAECWGSNTMEKEKNEPFWLRYAADRWMTTSGHRRKRPLGKKEKYFCQQTRSG